LPKGGGAGKECNYTNGFSLFVEDAPARQ